MAINCFKPEHSHRDLQPDVNIGHVAITVA
jgi:hypothetical protein